MAAQWAGVWPRGPVWERQGAHSARPRLPRPLCAGPGPGHRGRCYGWWNPVPGGSAPLMGEPGCGWRGRQGAPVGYPSCGRRGTSQGRTPRPAKFDSSLSCPEARNFPQPRAQRQGRLCKLWTEQPLQSLPSATLPLLQTLPLQTAPHPTLLLQIQLLHRFGYIFGRVLCYSPYKPPGPNQLCEYTAISAFTIQTWEGSSYVCQGDIFIMAIFQQVKIKRKEPSS